MTRDAVVKEILTLDLAKKVIGSISAKALKLAAECAEVVTNCFSKCIVDILSLL